jgi:hypothetical protein
VRSPTVSFRHCPPLAVPSSFLTCHRRNSAAHVDVGPNQSVRPNASPAPPVQARHRVPNRLRRHTPGNGRHLRLVMAWVLRARSRPLVPVPTSRRTLSELAHRGRRGLPCPVRELADSLTGRAGVGRARGSGDVQRRASGELGELDVPFMSSSAPRQHGLRAFTLCVRCPEHRGVDSSLTCDAPHSVLAVSHSAV